MKTNRGMVKVILLSLITFGIYGLYFYTTVGLDLNAAYPQGKKTMNFLLVTFVFSWLTLGIVPLVWIHRVYAKLGKALKENGIDYKVGAGTFWGWGVLGSYILVGPFIALHKLCKGLNLLAEAHNNRVA